MSLLPVLLPLFLSTSTTTPLIGQEEDPHKARSTVITSERLEVINTETGNLFIFDGSVSIDGADFTANCDRMEVRTDAKGKDDFGTIAVIEAIGNVRIQQGVRLATAGKAIIYPHGDEVVLEKEPKVTDENGTIEGYRMILRGEDRRIVIEPGPDGERTKVELPSLDVIRPSDSDE